MDQLATFQHSVAQPKSVDFVPRVVRNVLRSPGRPLEAAARAPAESDFGRDLSGVRIHTDSTAAVSARAINAAAYTVGRDVLFDAGRCAADSREGQRLLHHELAHVVQQNAASWTGTDLKVGATDTPCEQQAQQIATTATPGAAGVLQRQCACGQNTSEGEGEECKEKDRERRLQLATIDRSPVNEVPALVHDVLLSPGQPLDAATRAVMEPRFGYDFSRVRLHTEAPAAESAWAVNALAYTVGRDVVFGPGQYAPGTTQGRRLLAHELAHVVQQGAAEQSSAAIDRPDSENERAAHAAADQVVSDRKVDGVGSARPGGLQRDEADEEERRQMELQMPQFRLREPVLGESLGALVRPPSSLNVPPLQLDPQIAAQIRAIQFMQGLIALDNIRRALRDVGDFGLPSPATPGTGPALSPQATPPPGPLVPRGAGPSTPRAATIGDLLDAVMGIPVVQNGITRLRSAAEDRLRRDWNRLSGGERALLITQGVLITGGALAGVLANNEGRRFVLDQIQGRTIPIPGLPMTFQFNVTGPDQRFVLGLNVGALLPRELGFR